MHLPRRYGTDEAGWDGLSDQTLFIRHLVDGGGRGGANGVPDVFVDHYQAAFAGTGGRHLNADMDVAPGGALRNAVTDTLPVVLHCPGAARFQAEFERLGARGWDTPVRRC